MKPSSSISSARVNVSQIDFTVRVLPFEPKVKNVHLCEQQQAAVQKISLPKLSSPTFLIVASCSHAQRKA
uniref:Uncharacterized protein n=1 Tax=Ditylenchus dipsaci TaxID=166011 RepID=A0A915DDA1_9BILA